MSKKAQTSLRRASYSVLQRVGGVAAVTSQTAMRIPWSWWFLLVVATRVLVRSQCDTKCKERVKRIIGEYVDTSQMDSYQFKSYRWTRNSPTTAGNPRWRVKQRFALACIYYAISGDAWDFNTGWLTDDDECTWDGIECNARGFVRKIDLVRCFLASSCMFAFTMCSLVLLE